MLDEHLYVYILIQAWYYHSEWQAAWHQHSPVHSTCRPHPSLPKGSGSGSWSQYQQALQLSVWSSLFMLPVAIVGNERLHRCEVVSPDAVHEIPGPALGVRWELAE